MSCHLLISLMTHVGLKMCRPVEVKGQMPCSYRTHTGNIELSRGPYTISDWIVSTCIYPVYIYTYDQL